MKTVTGYLPIQTGKVIIDGSDITKHPEQTKHKIGYLPEHNPLYLDMYVKEQLAFSGNIFGMKGKILAAQMEKVIEMTGLESHSHKKIGSLSKGYRQRVGLAMALLHEPQVLILDEPTTGLDPNQIIEIRNLIKEVGKQKTIIFSTHILQEVEAVCDRVVIIHKGKIVADALVEQLRQRNYAGFVVEFSAAVSPESLATIEHVQRVEHLGGFRYLLEAEPDTDPRPHVFNYAATQNLSLLTLSQKEHNLEAIFKELTA